MAEMRMSELATRAELPVATIKYYLREGLLQPGRRTGVNQAAYDERHLERLRLIRALSRIAGLPLAKVREVVRTVDGDPSLLDAMAVTQDALVGEATDEERILGGVAEAERELSGTLAALGWRAHPDSPAHRAAVRAIAELRAEGLDDAVVRLPEYARAADEVGRLDVEIVARAEGLDAMIRGVVLGSVLRRPLLDALVLLAQQHHAAALADPRRASDEGIPD